MIIQNKCLHIKISVIIFIFYACVPSAKKTDDITKPNAMDNTNSGTQKLKPSETFTVALKGRGALGLQLLYRTDNDSIVEVSRIETDTDKNISPGDSIHIVYQIKAVKKGNVKITFYETQPWNKDFKEVIQKEINVEIGRAHV